MCNNDKEYIDCELSAKAHIEWTLSRVVSIVSHCLGLFKQSTIIWLCFFFAIFFSVGYTAVFVVVVVEKIDCLLVPVFTQIF